MGMDKVVDFIKEILPMSKEEEKGLEFIRAFITNPEFKRVEKLLKLDKIEISQFVLKTSFVKSKPFPQIKIIPDSKISQADQKFTTELNESVKNEIRKRIEKQSARKIDFTKYIATNIKGMEYVKKAVSLQLFASEPVHILLLGDPGTGKTEILRSVEELHPISVFGLGSGTSGAGLSISMSGGKPVLGLLPKAHKGICCIDELNLMKPEDMASLYSSMEKGFITYDKGSHHIKEKAEARILATANPVGDKFKGTELEKLKAQVPFDSALLTRFHLVFLIRKPSLKAFIDITRKILANKKETKNDNDISFLNEYIKEAENIKVKLSAKHQRSITKFIAELKKSEEDYLVEISPRTVIGFMRLAKACARMHFRNEVNEEDIEYVKEIMINSLHFE
jgi:replicative DNA helicase Mcm